MHCAVGQGFTPLVGLAQVDADGASGTGSPDELSSKDHGYVRDSAGPMWAASFSHGGPSASTCAASATGAKPCGIGELGEHPCASYPKPWRPAVRASARRALHAGCLSDGRL